MERFMGGVFGRFRVDIVHIIKQAVKTAKTVIPEAAFVNFPGVAGPIKLISQLTVTEYFIRFNNILENTFTFICILRVFVGVVF